MFYYTYKNRGGNYVFRANMEASYHYDVGAAIDAPLTAASMEAVISFVEERCAIEDCIVYYLHIVNEKAIRHYALLLLILTL